MAAEGIDNLDVLLKQALELHAAGNKDPKIEEIVKKISIIQQETIRVLTLRRDNELEKEKRHQEQMEEHKKKIADLRTELTEEKLKQRKQRMELQDQLEDLMGKHKDLAAFYNPKRIEAEISHMEQLTKELIQEEKEKQRMLKEVEEKETELIQQGVLTPENVFLRSMEAACAITLCEEDNAVIQSMLEAATADHTEQLDKYNRLKAELEEEEKKLSQMQAAYSGDGHHRTPHFGWSPLNK
ncbi:synaptonemal complex central element protein 1-like isoform X2 [Hyperolius riggenbachi]|uniref:synaptonemal complex central element protein 1-like isoform X2 n=1 Tax=Hyperolius riggenbachi TaxID=752182 RepID=UPI0035A2716A